ncbi:MAG: NAD(P)-dependent oxidoreductase [Hyphomicrobiaceae bacterium]
MAGNVGVIGLGVLGEAIATVLMRSGLTVIGYDIDPAARERAQQTGVRVARNVAELTAAVSTVITCLPVAKALFDVIDGADGIAPSPGGLEMVIEVSTLAVSEKLAARDKCAALGLRIVDCPVSGNRAMALKNGLTAFCSGQREDFDRVQGILERLCRTVHFVGDYGNGTKTKLAGNILNLVHNAAAAEVMVLAMKSGLDPEVFHAAVAGSASSSAMFEARGRLMVADDYDADGQNFSIPMKDAKTIAAHAAAYQCPTPIYQASLQLYHAAMAEGLDHLDPASVCRVVEKAANYTRQKD